MKIDTSTLIRFLNNDLSTAQMQEVRILIEKNSKVKLRFEEIKSFKNNFQDSIKQIENTKIPENLEKRLSIPRNQFNKKHTSKFANFYKIAASILIVISFGAIIFLPDKIYLSEKPLTQIKKENNIVIFYEKETLNDFLKKNSNCSKPEAFLDKDGREVYAVSCLK